MSYYIFATISLFLLSTQAIALSYKHYSDEYFTSIHVLVVDPHKHNIEPVKAVGDPTARETVAILANRYQALAAINGGFWTPNGAPAGILKINHIWYGFPTKPRGAIGWADHGKKVLLDRVLTFNSEGTEIKVFSVTSYTTAQEWKLMDHIVGGTPLLIRKGNLIEDYSSEQTIESFLIKQHPRTAVGIRNNGDWVFVVVDGRFNGQFGGMTMKELAHLMLKLGCVEALNLDGGSSSTMVINGIVVNEPCGSILEDGKHVEAVSDAILVLPNAS